MPLTSKGEKIMHAMQEQYGEEKGKSVFYASKSAGKISGVDEAAEPKEPAGPAGPERPTWDFKEVASLDSLKARAKGPPT